MSQPLSTYRLQLTPSFNFDDAASVIPYLARLEMRIALEEWHATIPDYHVAAGTELRFWGGTNMAIQKLPITWQHAQQ